MSNYEVDSLLSIGKNKKIIGVLKDELRRRRIKKSLLHQDQKCFLKDDRKVN